jgi:AcrR family transcriptional regulator
MVVPRVGRTIRSYCQFAVSGADAQMDVIAARAGVGVGTVYRHFPTKEALVTQLVRARFEEFVANARVSLEREDPWEAFASFMHANAAGVVRPDFSRRTSAW